MKNNLVLVIFFGLVSTAFGVEDLEEIELRAKKEDDHKASSWSDSSKLMDGVSGVSFQSGGGITSIPFIQGLGDERIQIKVDGANITSSCSNHMNPALSYVDPEKVEKIKVISGIAPVSYGGDSLGSSVVVESKKPQFSANESPVQKLRLKSYFRSNNENMGGILDYALSTRDLSLSYSGSDEHARNYREGNGKRIKGTLYNQNNQMVTVGRRTSSGVTTLKLSRTNIPYQGFANQYMDLEDNVANLLNLGFKGEVGNIFVDTSVFYQHTNHYMNKLNSQRAGNMPMYTRSDEMGFNFKGEYEFSKKANFIFGSELAIYRLDDWWPPVTTTVSGMGPGTFESISNGERDRLAFFAELDSSWSQELSTNFGIRTDLVSMDAGDVVGYNNTTNAPNDATAFNSRNHKKYDVNFDTVLSGKYRLNKGMDVELGLGRKSRSPNLYERYAWAGTTSSPSGPIAMDMRMINWFGDGNGYVGNLDLNPEVAHKVSMTFSFHDEVSKKWSLKITPHYSDVHDFIDADVIGQFNNRNYLKFENHDAIVYGADLSYEQKIISSKTRGDVQVKLLGSYVRGYRKDKKADLYHLMPLNGKLFIEHTLGRWTTDLGMYLVEKKEAVNDLRLEGKTPGYATFDVGTSYRLKKNIKLDFGISNLLDKHYYLPLGGVDIVNSPSGKLSGLSGMGRSYNGALTIDLI